MALKQRVYVVSSDQDLKACCSPDGPLIITKSLNEVLSHGRGSAVLHDLVFVAVSESDDVREQLRQQVLGLKVTISSGYWSGAKMNFEPGRVSVSDLEIEEVVLDEVVGQAISCTGLWCTDRRHVG